ncbi:MAG TPA: LuxR C-terminal-related transcriptional regulator [Baekduia sp.]|nr:LuxR C-terminal-related transcriptional regulator [Baekduia sp.]
MQRTAEWTTGGRPLRDAELAGRVADAVARAHQVVGDAPADGAPWTPAEIEAAEARIDEVTAALLAGGGAHGALLVELRDLRAELGARRAAQRLEAVSGLQKALEKLRGVASFDRLMQRAPEVIVTHLGFDRVIISRVEERLWIPVNVHVRGDPEWAERILAAAAGHTQPLDRMVIETEMVRRRGPVLVRDVQERQDVHLPIASTSDSRSYAAAPIMPEGSVIGFLHADHYLSRRHPDEFDRDLLFAFAEAFGLVVERTVLSGRLRAQGDRVRSLAASLEGVIEELRDAEVRLEGAPAPTGEAAVRRAPAPPADHRLASLLTTRELEVTRLLANGASNAEIANRLVISEGTVKSHVKQILRKLRAANRAEAASKYVRLVGLPPRPG